MSQTFCKLYVHLVFRIKSNSPALLNEDLERIHEYIGKMIGISGCKDIKVGGIVDHVHVLFLLPKGMSLSKVAEEVKSRTSRWIKNLDSYYQTFSWQRGYGAFSVSQSMVQKTFDYIAKQKEHHRKRDFNEEYRMILELNNIKFNDKYDFSD